MTNQFLNFEDTTVQIGGKTMFAVSASMQISPKIGADRVYGSFNKDIVGSTTQLHRQAAQAPIEGSLDVTFYLTSEFFSETLEPDSLFDVKNVDENPIKNNRIGRYILGDLYLNKFNFKLKPFGVVHATASYFMTGTLYRERGSNRIPFSEMEHFDPAHALRCFVVAKAGGDDLQDIDDVEEDEGNPIDYTFEITDLDYSITVERNKSALIRINEHSSVNTRPEGAKYSRVSVNNMESVMKITSNDLIDRLNPYGEYQKGGFVPENVSSICAYLYTVNGKPLAKFQSQGKVVDQSLNVNTDGMTDANITIKEIIK